MKIQIWSGEGDGPGTCETYTAEESHTMTWRKLTARLTRERCGGDRWAKATWEDGEPVVPSQLDQRRRYGSR